MKKSKITLAFLLTLILAMMLVGCSGGNSGAAANTISFKCVDQNGDPVEKVTVQACSGDLCRTAKSDADGIATFEAEDSYDVEVLKVPDGYTYTGEEEFTVTEKGSVTELTFVKE